MKKIWEWIKAHKPTKRRLIQLYAALLFNANLKGFGNGRIYQGPLKNLCTPGLNCYSCPGASGSCPIGALQNALSASDKRAPYYVIGILMLYGFLFGRWICGFLCPFGLIQDLLHKIPTPKLKKSRVTRVLSYFKYVILTVFCGIIPLLYMLKDFPLPAFCKYFCPAGTLEGAIGLLSNEVNASAFRMLGPLFTWKFLLMVSIIVAAVFIYRIFCRFLCPLGAIYGLFNRISIFGIKLERSKCIDCGKCTAVCKMDIRHVGDHECISCGACMNVCPTKAITWKGSKPMLAPNEIDASTPEEAETIAKEHNEKLQRKNKIVKIVAAVVMIAVLAGALIYYNLIDKAPGADTPPTTDTGNSNEGTDPDSQLPPVGGAVGNLCYATELPLYNAETKTFSDTFSVTSTRGKVTVINFWFTTCGPCVQEMPHFNEIAKEYGDKVAVIACHADLNGHGEVIDFINDKWSDFVIDFAYDTKDTYFQQLGGIEAYPHTVILDERGVITEINPGSMTYAEIKAAVDAALAANGADNSQKEEETTKNEESSTPGDGTTDPVQPTYGSAVGDLCHELDIPVIGDDPTGYTESFNISDTLGKITVINFWFTTCSPCISEMPYFNQLATDYAEDVQVIAIHADFGIPGKLDSTAYIEEHYSDFNILFGYDTGDAYYALLGGSESYPHTVILDENNVILAVFRGSVTYDSLKEVVDGQLAK